MIYLLPVQRDDIKSKQDVGKLIYNLKLVSKNQTCFETETSVILDNAEFSEYKRNKTVLESTVSRVVSLLQHLLITRATLYLSFFEECDVNDQPVTIRVSSVNIRNAFNELYARWFDAKPYAKRKTRHLADEDTYPSILIQSSSYDEQTTITRHPRTGALLRRADGISLVHCADISLDHSEEIMIKAVDSVLDLPGKIVYTRDPMDGSIIVRRIEEYNLTAQAFLDYLLAKLKAGIFSPEKFLSLLKPEQIASVSAEGYCLTHEIQYEGVQRTRRSSVMGHACFPWTDISQLPEDPIFIAYDITFVEAEILSKCKGAIFTSSGITHGTVMCSGMDIPCINGVSGLYIGGWNKEALTEDKREIHEGDIICILGNRWTLGGMLVPGEKYHAVCSRETLWKIRDVLAPFTEESRLKELSVKEQIHISMLIKYMRGCGWLQ